MQGYRLAWSNPPVQTLRKGVCACALERGGGYIVTVATLSFDYYWDEGEEFQLTYKTLETFEFWLLCLSPGCQQSTSEWQQAADGHEVHQVCPIQPVSQHFWFLRQLCSRRPSVAVTTPYPRVSIHPQPNHHPPLCCWYTACSWQLFHICLCFFVESSDWFFLDRTVGDVYW